ncbi:MAG TPA: thioredoxin family protein [Steroidobacteraceae bacterium]|nr:thioredoxin family protein [Steroidobacteraceae bacterium]
MRKLMFWMLLLTAAAPAALASSGNVVVAPNVQAHLESAVRSVGPGQSFLVALVLDLREGWHTYWRNPGDSGEATRLAWTLPRGFRAGPIEWPAPQRFVLAPLVNFGYAKQAVYLVRIDAPASLRAPGPLKLRARANWLVCSNVCIPESAQLRLTLPAGATPGAADPATAALFARARAQLPKEAAGSASARVRDGRLILTLGPGLDPRLAHIGSLQFIPYTDGEIVYAAPQIMTRAGGSIELSMQLGDQPPTAGKIRGILLAIAPAGAAPTSIALAIAPPLQIAGAQVPRRGAAGTAAAAATPAFWTLIGLALLGGLILNLMPCVLPVLSIKAVSLVEQARSHPRDVRLKGLAFAAGVIASMLTLALVLLSLRAGGELVGWGFQLQAPLFVTLMAYLLFLVGLNLSGVFEFGGGGAGLGENLTRGDNRRAAFFTGVLTTLVATPCTAPFMAAAVGAALTQSAPRALAIFAALGVGLSLPLAALSFAPWLRRALPKPGAWMETLKQVLAFPMYASAAWLVWVLAQQTSSTGLAAALAGLVLLSLAAWSYQRARGRAGRGRLAATAAAAIALLAALALPATLDGAPATPAAAPGRPGAGTWESYDPARVARLRAAGRPLLIDFTASWCLTCLVNDRTALANPSVLALLRAKGVTLVKGDWTNGDPRITAALAKFGRAGVPLYVVYDATPGSHRALVLPQLLTASIVENAFAALPGRHLH